MRYLLIILMLSGCGGLVPRIRRVEYCAHRGMNFAGITYSNGVEKSLESTGIVCTVPTVTDTTEARCQRNALNAASLIRTDFNERGRKFVVFLGVCAFLIPGIIASVAFNASADAADIEADKVYEKALKECMCFANK